MSRPSTTQPFNLTAEQHALFTKFIPLAYRIAQKMSARTGVDRDDLLSASMLGIAKAAATFDPTKATFMTYAFKIAQNNCRSEILKMNRQCQKIGNEAVAPNEQFIKHDRPQQFDLTDVRWSDLLTDQERGVALMRGNGLTLDRIGKLLGFTRQRVQQIEARAISKIRAAIGHVPDDVADERIEENRQNVLAHKRSLKARRRHEAEVRNVARYLELTECAA